MSSLLHDRYVELWELNKTYKTPKGPAVIVRDFTLNIQQGEFISVIGHSGCGKSTVLMMLAGLTPKTSGNMVLAGKEILGAGPDRGIVFQAPSLLPWMTAEQNVQLGVDQVCPGKSVNERRDIARHYLDLVGLGKSMHKTPGELSGGMRQRVGIARAFALSPKMLLLDEPFGMLDQLTRMELQDVLLDLVAHDRKTAMMVTHDVDEALYLSDRIVMMTSGPAATIGQVMDVPFVRPRVRRDVVEHEQYYTLREELIEFLESQDHRPSKPKESGSSGMLGAAPQSTASEPVAAAS